MLVYDQAVVFPPDAAAAGAGAGAVPLFVYFAFPKCASDAVRQHLKRHYKIRAGKDPICNQFTAFGVWEDFPVNYFHCSPARFLASEVLRENGMMLPKVTVVRNVYARLLSCWTFLRHNMDVRTFVFRATFDTFPQFIKTIGLLHVENEDGQCMGALPMYWMYMPFERYFGAVKDDLTHVFFVERLDDFSVFMDSLVVSSATATATFDPTIRTNTSKHDAAFQQYYTPEMRSVVDRVYAYEIKRFGFDFDDETKHVSVSKSI